MPSNPQSASWRGYRLRPNKALDTALVLELQATGAGPPRSLMLPNADQAEFLLIPRRATPPVRFESSDFTFEPLGRRASLAAWARSRVTLRRKRRLEFADATIIAAGPSASRRMFARVNRWMSKVGMAIDGWAPRRHPELFRGWRPAEPPPPRPVLATPLKIAVVAHLYFADLWPEIAAVLQRLPAGFDVIVTVPPERPELTDAIRRLLPEARVRVVENRGRDIRPFLVLLEQGELDGYDLVCKIHGKKSEGGGRSLVMGALWRRRLLFDLLAAPDAVGDIVAMFEARPRLGLVGSRILRYPSRLCRERLAWGDNRALVLRLAEEMGAAVERFRLDYFAGTMFWVRPAALAPLRRLGLVARFDPEQGRLDGGLDHAVERLFTPTVEQAGFEVADIDWLARPAPPATG